MSNSTLTSITRRPPRLKPPPDSHAHNPHFWLGTLAASIHGHLTFAQPDDRLERDYRDFLESPSCSDELRAMLEGP